MSYNTRVEDSKRMKIRNLVAKNDYNRGSGPHGKSQKAKRTAVRQKLRTNLDELLADELELDY